MATDVAELTTASGLDFPTLLNVAVARQSGRVDATRHLLTVCAALPLAACRWRQSPGEVPVYLANSWSKALVLE